MEALQWAVWVVRLQVEGRGWLEANGAFVVAVLALLGSAATGYWGWRQKRQPTGEAQLDDERQYRLELRAENRDLKAEVAEVEKLNDALNAQNKQLRKENEHLLDIKEKLDKQILLLIEEKAITTLEIMGLKKDVLRLTGQVTGLEAELERRKADTGREARRDDK